MPAPLQKTVKRETRATFGKTGSDSWVKKSVDTSFLQDQTFGRPNRPSTPIYGVMTNEYGREWEAKQAAAKAKTDAAAEKKKKTPIKPQPTIASKGHTKTAPAPEKERFVMKRFADTEKKVVTQWDHTPRRRGDGEIESECDHTCNHSETSQSEFVVQTQ